jgi:hypothetical protein
VFYCHPDVLSMLENKIYNKGNMAFTIKDITDANGMNQQGVLNFLGIPVRPCEQISLAETLLTA